MSVAYHDLESLLNSDWYVNPTAGYYLFEGKVFMEGAAFYNPPSSGGMIPLLSAGTLPSGHRPSVNTTVKFFVDNAASFADFGGIDFYEATVGTDGSIVLVARSGDERTLPNGYRLATLNFGGAWWDIPATDITLPKEPLDLSDRLQDFTPGTTPILFEGGGQVAAEGSIVAAADGANQICNTSGTSPASPTIFSTVPIKELGVESWWLSDAAISGAWALKQKWSAPESLLDYDPEGPDEPWIGKDYDTESFTGVTFDDGLYMGGEVGGEGLGEDEYREVGGTCLALQSTSVGAVNALVMSLDGRSTPFDQRFYLGRVRRNPSNATQYKLELWEYDTDNSPWAELKASSSYSSITTGSRDALHTLRMEIRFVSGSYRVRFIMNSSFVQFTQATILPPGECGWLNTDAGATWDERLWVKGVLDPLTDSFRFPPSGMEFDLSETWWRGGRELAEELFMMVV